jgi:hypothetical protein
VLHGRINGVQLTVPRGFLSDKAFADIDAFYVDTLGWSKRDASWEAETWGEKCLMLAPTPDQTVIVTEAEHPLPSPPDEMTTDLHVLPPPLLFVSYGTFEAVDEVLEACRRYQERDSTLKVVDFPVTPYHNVLCRNITLLYYLPIWIDVNAAKPA